MDTDIEAVQQRLEDHINTMGTPLCQPTRSRTMFGTVVSAAL